jgi:hypothetical protein
MALKTECLAYLPIMIRDKAVSSAIAGDEMNMSKGSGARHQS